MATFAPTARLKISTHGLLIHPERAEWQLTDAPEAARTGQFSKLNVNSEKRTRASKLADKPVKSGATGSDEIKPPLLGFTVVTTKMSDDDGMTKDQLREALSKSIEAEWLARRAEEQAIAVKLHKQQNHAKVAADASESDHPKSIRSLCKQQ